MEHKPLNANNPLQYEQQEKGEMRYKKILPHEK